MARFSSPAAPLLAALWITAACSRDVVFNPGASGGEGGAPDPSTGGRQSTKTGGRSGSGGGNGETHSGGTANAGSGGEATGGRSGGGSDSGTGGSTTSGCDDLDCPTDAPCLEQDGDAFCDCGEGYEWNGDSCTDVDECNDDPRCSPFAACENEPGTYTCSCLEEYWGDGRTCWPRLLLASGRNGEIGNFLAINPAVSGDGRFVAFSSAASNLVGGDRNGVEDVFVLDRESGELERVSINSSDLEGNDGSAYPALSNDGRYVAFASYADNLVASDFNADLDVFRRDREQGTTLRVSVTHTGGEALGANGFSPFPSISDDGNLVAFTSFSPNLVEDDSNVSLDVFVRDVSKATTQRVSVTALGEELTDSANPVNMNPQLSGAGRYVVFASSSRQLGGSYDSHIDVFRKDLRTGAIGQVSFTTPTDGPNESSEAPSISSDGRFVVFESYASNLVAGDTNSSKDIFLFDVTANIIERVSVGAGDEEANGNSYLGYGRAISDDGRYVVFSSIATNLVRDDTNDYTDIFLRDRLNKTTTRISLGPHQEESDGPSNYPTCSADGLVVAFESMSSTFGAPSVGSPQVWVRDLRP